METLYYIVVISSAFSGNYCLDNYRDCVRVVELNETHPEIMCEAVQITPEEKQTFCKNDLRKQRKYAVTRDTTSE